MSAQVHSTAIVDRSATLGAGVSIGPHAVIGAGVRIGDDTEIGAGAQVEGPTVLGEGNRVFPHACVGFDPQDLKYKGEETTLTIGDGNVFREFCTVHRGTVHGGGKTTVGSGNLFMTYTHVAHDCHVGDKTIFANAGTLAGHVVVEDGATGGFSVITMDALPFMKTVGARPVCLGVNRIGLERKGFPAEVIKNIEDAMRVLLRSGLNTTQAIETLQRDFSGSDEVQQIVQFASSSERGLIKALPGKRGQRRSR
jgi:UDP-N-acetylglucosamine acyltransferase